MNNKKEELKEDLNMTSEISFVKLLAGARVKTIGSNLRCSLHETGPWFELDFQARAKSDTEISFVKSHQ